MQKAFALTGRLDLHVALQEPSGFKDFNDQLRAKPHRLFPIARRCLPSFDAKRHGQWKVFVTNSHSPIRAEETAFERHYTPQQLADLWLLHESTIRRLFLDEPGVLKYGKASRHDGRRDYITLRIPESVARRVYARRSR